MKLLEQPIRQIIEPNRTPSKRKKASYETSSFVGEAKTKPPKQFSGLSQPHKLYPSFFTLSPHR